MARFAYMGFGSSLMPLLSLMLSHSGRTIEATGLLDTGAAVNVLPYHLGLALGATWEDQSVPVSLAGTLGQLEAKALMIEASHPQITGTQKVRLAFAWTQAEQVPLILGQINFFLEFDVCFFRAQGVFDVTIRS